MGDCRSWARWKRLPESGNMPGYCLLYTSIKVKDLAFENFEIVNAKEVVVAQIKLTRAARAAAQEGK